jgi:hypothetical protein
MKNIIILIHLVKRHYLYAKSSSIDASGNYIDRDVSGIYIGLANTQYTYNLTGLSVDISYNISVVTEYETKNSYTTTWPNVIKIK